MDLGSLASIRAAVKEFESWNVVLDVLINNAAVMAAPYSTTVDGFETQFGVGHLGVSKSLNFPCYSTPEKGTI